MIGITNGAFIALIALGYTLVYGIIELINFAHGDLFMLGTFVCLSTLTLLGFSSEVGASGTPWLALLLAMVAAMIFCGALNTLAERIAYRPLRRAPRLAPLISAIGVSFIFVNIGLFWQGPTPRRFPDLLPQYDFISEFFGITSLVRFTFKDLFVLSLAIPLMLGLAWVIRSTRIGKAMRAVAQDTEMSLQMGIDVDRVIAFTFLIGGVLAGAAAMLYTLKIPSGIIFSGGFILGIKAFSAAVLGGIGNLRGALLGGLILGVVENYGQILFGTEWRDVVAFVLLVLVLMFRPTGILGESLGKARV